MATYNGAQYIGEQIDSIIGQTNKDWELYIRDDGSSDNTLEIVKQFCNQYSNIHLTADPQLHRGSRDSFMWLLENIDSDLYMFCDQDDVWLPEKIEESIKMIPKDNKPFVICTNLRVVDSNLNTLNDSFWEIKQIGIDDFNDFKLRWTQNNVAGCTMLFDAKTKKICFPYPKSASMHDAWISLSTLANGGRIIPIQKQLMLYRQHEKNVVGAKDKGVLHYFTETNAVIGRMFSQYKTIKFLYPVSFLTFIFFKVIKRVQNP